MTSKKSLNTQLAFVKVEGEEQMAKSLYNIVNFLNQDIGIVQKMKKAENCGCAKCEQFLKHASQATKAIELLQTNLPLLDTVLDTPENTVIIEKESVAPTDSTIH